MTLKIGKFIKKYGEQFTVRRSGRNFKAAGLTRDDESPPYIAFEPGTDIQVADELRGDASGNAYRIVRVDHDVAHGRPFQLRAFIDQQIAQLPGGIQIGSMVNSAIQQNSPGAVQMITITDEQRVVTSRIVDDVYSVLPQLNLGPEDYNDLSAELETIKAQLKLSNPKSTTLRESLGNVKSILETTAAAGGTWTLINDIIPRIASLLY